MNEQPPYDDPPDDLDEQYRRASNRDASRPSESVRLAVLRRAQELAAERASTPTSGRFGLKRFAANQRHWRTAAYGGFAAAALAGLLILPRSLAPEHPPPAAARSRVPDVESAAPSRDVSAETPGSRSLAASAPAPTRPATAGRPPGAAVPRASYATPPLPLEGARAASSAAAARMPDRPSPAQALQQAAAAGNVPELQVLMAQKANVNARDSSGRTALMLAVLHGQRSAVDTLIAAGADPNAADSQGTTPLKAAMEADQPEIVAALRRAGAR